MRGAPDNLHPQAFIQAPFAQVVRQLVAVMRVVQPQVVVTFNRYGGYGHPDHIMVHRATVAAVPVAGAAHHVDGYATWEPQKLYYANFGSQWLKVVNAGLHLLGKDPRRVGTNADVNLVEAAAQAGTITTSIDTHAYQEQKLRAWQCHQSQVGEMAYLLKLPVVLRRRFVAMEHFTRVIPPWQRDHPPEDDLFAGLPL
jgi:mycothiol S-conjugate amidase